MRNSECSGIREKLRSASPSPEVERHLFACAACRASLRVAAAWKELPRPSALELPEQADEDFVARVLDAVRQDRRRRQQSRLLLAAAATLLFFICAGAAQELFWKALSSTEEAYAQLTAPSVLEELLPE